MGNFHISIRGVGIHDNGLEHDADRMAREFVRQLREAGHTVNSAAITCGGETVIVDATADQRDALAHDTKLLQQAGEDMRAERAALEVERAQFDAHLAQAKAAQAAAVAPVVTPAPVIPPAPAADTTAAETTAPPAEATPAA